MTLKPPPRIPTVAPTELRSPRGGVGFKTIAAFVLLSAMALGVFFLLPGWVEENTAAVAQPLEPERGAIRDAPVVAADDLRALAQIKSRAEAARGRATSLRDELQSKDVSRWGGRSFREAIGLIAAGDQDIGARDYEMAARNYERAIAGLEGLGARAVEVAGEAMARGREALSSGDSAEAQEAFELALRIQPSNEAARRGLARARSLDEVLALLASGEQSERNGDLKSAAESYRNAVALDPASKPARQALERLDARASEKAFTEAMSEAVAALAREDFRRAREGFERAKAIRPEASEVQDGLAQVEEGLRLEAIAAHRARAVALEAREEWRKAEEEYRAALGLDPTIRFAQEGAARSAERAELSERLDFHLKHPERLSDENVLEEARSLLTAASAIDSSGPKLAGQVAKLEELVRAYSTSVQVHLLSDGETEVTVYKVGHLGKFERRALELRPGSYTVVGSRRGYRDVRLKLVVETGKAPEPLLVRCEEKI